ncbi:MAG: hypothetical protein ACD_52C00327G0010 [uncultured bacterium]|uniref:DNA-deoxyinosine glycosylase n=1 Tax=Candidatus Woesebacteria bacterium RIFCSPHIGHO2_12_FULL_41_24 TaxID=1802510 RepID=A0A1F8ARZ6_9BACT|nr:MAG: hypothetical protein ACD_52C00327G0010 [uncultured bacterium]OGM14081.1 MAG: hypothetical protein A2W15_03360 [Candidatus Woesebacteria bacterium RBG_16_41_13]OGM29393.1 MAG: hypothetical protein A2873_04615 [Candidatus Woesebacteria bacterium RIFCSPHIGHO2_01_FULL_42_80]OGM34842.1 MAG: hypothetical protein A3D84_03170 [Candidatus Woesebacteria bacterium RIFCSPHIGHO2_02_FULL_42_20]OGM54471.1 MAG: hypothetical protein A3E44_00205 [Candidatus Woesebacteria bacterium RIFCSPHIGHO2_12_FULL_41
MIEKHPFGNFVLVKSKYLLLGSFVAKPADGYEWFYANGRNLFWPILEEVYGINLRTKKAQQHLFTRLGLAITDIILECDRENNSNSDMNLKCLVFNTQAIAEIVKKNKITSIYFTSRFVEKLFKKEFKDLILKFPKIELITLPSPSPRYALMSKSQKVTIYKNLLPRLK